MNRSAGILLSISSLPSSYGIGCFDEAAYRCVDWLSCAGQTYWQILPLGPTSYGDSPYQSFSTFAGNPYFISLQEFIKNGSLTKEECDAAGLDDGAGIDYAKQYHNRLPLLRRAYEKSDDETLGDIALFCSQNPWLEDYALFMALKDKFGGASWDSWDNDIKMREDAAIERYTAELQKDIGFYKFLQYHFHIQWTELKKYANGKGIKIIGDIPIYVAFDSADTWANPTLFQLDESKMPTAVAGCPPDGFAPDGQLWGNPLYNWDTHRERGYSWWIARTQNSFSLYDVVRIDHFRGFDEYYSIPYGEKTAKNGKWEKGPGIELFKAIEKALGKKDFIAEDLGFVTDTVRMLVYGSGFPGMKVLEFAFDSRDENNHNDYLPHNFNKNCVAYTGTHDNQTLFSWFDTITNEERQAAIDYLDENGIPPGKLSVRFISLIMQSKADLCIVPMQDWLELDDSARMNTPATVGQNWRWRMAENALTDDLCGEIRELTKKYGR